MAQDPTPQKVEVVTLPRNEPDPGTRAETEEIMSGFAALQQKAQEDADKAAKEAAAKKEEPEKKEPEKAEPEKKEPEKKEPEKKEEKELEKKEEKKEEKKSAFEDLSDEAIEKHVKALPTNKAETQRRYRELLGELKTEREAGRLTKTDYEQAKQELAAAKKAAEDAAKEVEETEEEKKAREAQEQEFAMLRRQYQLETDPALKKQYDDVVDAAEKTITDTLTAATLDKATLDLIAKEGGWLAFSRSGKPISWYEADPTAEGGKKLVNGTQADYAEKIYSALSRGNKEVLSAKVQEQINTRTAKERYMTEEKGKAKEFFEQQIKTAQGSQEQVKAQLEQIIKDYTGRVEKATKEGKEFDFLRDKEIPEKATAAEKATLTEHNATAATLRQFLADAPAAQTPELFTSLALYAARGLYSEKAGVTNAKEVATLTKQVKDLQAELATVRKAGRTVPAGGKVSGGGGPAAPAKDEGKEDDVESIVGGLRAKLEEEQ